MTVLFATFLGVLTPAPQAKCAGLILSSGDIPFGGGAGSTTDPPPSDAPLTEPAPPTETIVRFETNLGHFDVLLNPTNNPNLEPLTDNFLRYVNTGRYDNTVINRAEPNFVVQLGLFQADPTTVADFDTNQFPIIPAFDLVVLDADGDQQVDFNFSDVSNTRGTVGLALSSLNFNSGTSSFFVNLADNSFLDSQGFVPFAEIVDMAAIDAITDLSTVDITLQAGVRPNHIHYTDVPVVGANLNDFLIVQRAFVIPEPGSLGVLLIAAWGLIGFPRHARSSGV